MQHSFRGNPVIYELTGVPCQNNYFGSNAGPSLPYFGLEITLSYVDF